MQSINLVLAVHNHQPIGNFEKVFEEAYQHAYKPFLDVVSRFPTLRITQHWTGPLLEWLVNRHPETVDVLREMVHRGQLELLTGAYYEAVLAIIPEADRIGQIRKLTDFIQKTFDYAPRGIWLAERVWEQHLVKSLVKAGVEFVMVDDTHFRHAGLQDDQLLGYYVTEEEGLTLKVLPIDKTLRYAVPFRTVDDNLRYFQRMTSQDGTRILVAADDGEKLGVWPKTYKHVYEDHWLEAFCGMLSQNSDWIKTAHVGTLVGSLRPQGRIYLPTASYSEMMKWALPPPAFVGLEKFEQDLKDAHKYDENSMFVRGGFWRNFLAKYPESNHMHKKMLRVSRRLHMLARRQNLDQAIFDHLWAGQCNDAYWHGVFGGLYLPNLRFPVYRNLLQAETKLDEAEKLPTVRVEESDFDCDGSSEVLVESDICNLYFSPRLGGSLVELDFKPAAFNLLDVVGRREEGYHRRLLDRGPGTKKSETIHDGALAKEEGLHKYLHVDWYRRASFLDHFPAEGTTLEAFAQCSYRELGDFVNQPYVAAVRHSAQGAEVTLQRDGALWLDTGPHGIRVTKTLRYGAGTSDVVAEYTLANLAQHPLHVWFGVEFNVGLLAGNAHDRYYVVEGRELADRRLGSRGEDPHVSRWALVDEWLGIEVEFTVDEECVLWRFPVETVSLSEGGFERLYQSSVVLPTWKFLLEKEKRIGIVQSIRKR